MSPAEPTIRPLWTWMRWWFVAEAVLVTSAVIPLLLAPARTETTFAWTIQPPVTAAFLGAGYAASLVLVLVSARQPSWAAARVAVPGVLVFTTVTLAATLLHLDRFNLDSPHGLARFSAWTWLVVYLLATPVLLALLVGQLRRTAGVDPERRAPLPRWVRVVGGVQTAILIVTGLVLFAAPASAASLWPWPLTPLTARAVAAWLIGIGVTAAHALGENDWARLRAAMPTYALFGGLELAVTLAHAGAVDASRPATWLYGALLVSIVAVGGYGWWATVRHRVRAATPSAAPAAARPQ